MSYRDYEREEERRLWQEQRLKEETVRMQELIDKGYLASVLANLSLNKQNRNY